MITDINTKDITSIEEYTLFSLDKSPEGLDELISESNECGKLLSSSGIIESLELLRTVVGNLHDFSRFEAQLCGMFQIDRMQISDDTGDLHSCVETFRSNIMTIPQLLDREKTDELSKLFCDELPSVLKRMKELMHALRIYIDVEYLQEGIGEKSLKAC